VKETLLVIVLAMDVHSTDIEANVPLKRSTAMLPQEPIIITIPAVSGIFLDAVALATDLLPDMPQDVTSTVVVATEAVVHHAALFAHLGVRMVVFAHHLVYVPVQLDGRIAGALQI
jgi:hypothetical protein